MPATTPSHEVRSCAARRGRRSAASSSIAIGRAPIVKTSRRMPPTPVAAPWYGSMNDGWLCDSILKTRPRAVADVDDAGVLARSLDDARPRRRELPQVHARGLVRAVLAPHRREDAELDEVRLAAEDRRGCARTPRRRGRARGPVPRRVLPSADSRHATGAVPSAPPRGSSPPHRVGRACRGRSPPRAEPATRERAVRVGLSVDLAVRVAVAKDHRSISSSADTSVAAGSSPRRARWAS